MSTSHSGRRWLAVTSGVVVLSALAAVALWWEFWRERPVPPLDANWTAVVTVLAGDGVAGVRDGDPARAHFSDPFGIAVAPDGAVLVADGVDSHRIRRIAPDGSVSTLAGAAPGLIDGTAANARFDTPSGVATGADGTVYVADTGNNAIRRIAPDGTVSTIAGGGTSGYVDGTGAAARFNGPIALTVSPTGDIIVVDTYNDRVRLVRPDGRVSTVAGSGLLGMADGSAADARFDTPCGVAIDQRGNIYIADTGNNAIRVIAGGMVATVAPLPEGGLFRPTGVAVDASGTVFVTDEGGRVVELQPGVRARVLAGSTLGFADGAGPDARFRAPSGIAVQGEAKLVVTDRRNALVRLIEARGRARRPPARVSSNRSPFRLRRFRANSASLARAPAGGAL